MESTTIVRVTGFLSVNKYKTTVSEMDVNEMSKCFDTVDKPTKRFRKSRLGNLESNLKNVISGDSSAITFSVICLPEDTEKYKQVIKKEIYLLIKKYNTSTKTMLDVMEKNL